MRYLMILFVCVFSFTSCAGPQKGSPASAIYFGGDILTLEGDTPQYVEALVVGLEGRILFAGPLADAHELKGAETQMKDLEGKTLLPGFVDAHSHILSYSATVNVADLGSPPMGTVRNIPDIIRVLQENKMKHTLSDTAWIIGMNYDESLLEEKRHPEAKDLDAAFPTNPVIIGHISGHMAVANTAAMKAKGISAKTPEVPGGNIVRYPGSQEPTGLFQESAWFYYFLPEVLKPEPPEVQWKNLKQAFHTYAQEGITTAQDGLTNAEQISFLQEQLSTEKPPIDLVLLPSFEMVDSLVGTGKVEWGTYHNGLKFGGIKIITDGSPQGKTAYLSEPYLTDVPGCEKDCRGKPNLNPEQINQLVLTCFQSGVQVYSHCNGDASIDLMIEAIKKAKEGLEEKAEGRRPVIIHSQTVRPEQLDEYVALGILPSFFTNHTFFWGDAHYENLGEERAFFISPTATAKAKGIRFSNHTDFTVTPISQLLTVHTAVNRSTRSGMVLGPEERLNPFDALKAITIDAAYMYFEEDAKGTLQKGKLADLVILDKNPLKVDPGFIKDIQVLETVKEGRTVYKR